MSEDPLSPQERAEFRHAKAVAQKIAELLDDTMTPRQWGYVLSLLVAWHLVNQAPDKRRPISRMIVQLARYQLDKAERDMKARAN